MIILNSKKNGLDKLRKSARTTVFKELPCDISDAALNVNGAERASFLKRLRRGQNIWEEAVQESKGKDLRQDKGEGAIKTPTSKSFF